MPDEEYTPRLSLNHSEYQSQVYKAMLYANEPERLILIDDTMAYFNGDHRLHQLTRIGDTWVCDCTRSDKVWPCKHIIATEKILRRETDRLWNDCPLPAVAEVAVQSSHWSAADMANIAAFQEVV
ncbi:MAG: hypothetical protein KKA73_05140 [Chloroflexi bacterium]|nr:hypothetical protein [Chloroflexota bacterium]MBU1747053.1 hypothetical protein [Chloroflexota bacterium]